jgi:hypothetical protein
MDAIKPGSGVGFGAPILESGSPGGAGGASRFADVLSGGQPGGGASGAKSPFASPILDSDMGAKKMQGPESMAKQRVSSLDTEMRAHGHRHRHEVQVVGERGQAPGVQPSREPISMHKLANDTAKAESKIDAMVEAARKGKTFSPSELLGLQMEVFRYQQTVEVIGKTAEKVVGGIKQTLGTQV